MSEEKKALTEEDLRSANGGEDRGFQRVCPNCTQTYWTLDCKIVGFDVYCPNCDYLVDYIGPN